MFLTITLFPVFVAVAFGADCGLPDAKYPPALRFSGDKIYGLRQGIVGGNEAEPHSYPWQIRMSNGCGGSIVSEYFVATAAHCVATNNGQLKSSAMSIKVEVGAHKRWSGRSHEIQWIGVHQGYRGTCNGQGDDIAMLMLKQPIQFNSEVKPICLPSSSDDFRNHGKVVVSGWGDLYSGANRGSDVLRHVVVDTVHSKCKTNYGRSFNGDKEMCAGSTGKDSCQGDSGGPLFVRKNSKYYLAGIVSCGWGCADPKYPGVYTHVPKYVSWIKQTAGI